jgi:hypothetical protein
MRYTVHVEGSPWQVGDLVTVTSLTDQDGLVIGNEAYLGLTGKAQTLVYDEGDGEGNGTTYPGDPEILVLFESGEVGAFWSEELALAGPEVAIRRPVKVELRFVAMYTQEDAKP